MKQIKFKRRKKNKHMRKGRERAKITGLKNRKKIIKKQIRGQEEKNAKKKER